MNTEVSGNTEVAISLNSNSIVGQPCPVMSKSEVTLSFSVSEMSSL